MDRLAELREAYREVGRVGQELLQALQGEVTAEMVDQVTRLVAQREAATKRTTALFQADDQEALRDDLLALLQQQRAIESQMARLSASLQQSGAELRKARSTVGSVRRVLKTNPKAKWINELR